MADAVAELANFVVLYAALGVGLLCVGVTAAVALAPLIDGLSRGWRDHVDASVVLKGLPAAIFPAGPANTGSEKQYASTFLRWPRRMLLSGIRDGIFIQVNFAPRAPFGQKLSIVVAAPGPQFWEQSELGSQDLTKCPEDSLFTHVGEPRFDKHVWIGEPHSSPLAAFLGEENRSCLLEACADWLSPIVLHTSPFTLHLSQVSRYENCRFQKKSLLSELEDRLLACVKFAKTFPVAPDRIPSLLLQNATKDTSALVRRQNLELLVQDFSDTDEARTAIAAAFYDPDALVNVTAAALSGGDLGFQQLTVAIRLETVPTNIRLVALRHLLRVYPEPKVWPEVERAAAGSDASWRRSVLFEAAAVGLFDHLCEFTQRCQTDDLGYLLELLGGMGNTSVETILLGHLAHPMAEVRASAIRSLGRVGGVGAVESLLHIVEDRLLGDIACTTLLLIHERTQSPDDATCAELRQIQMRRSASNYGRLSVSSPEQDLGAISLSNPAGGETGSVALAEQEGGSAYPPARERP